MQIADVLPPFPSLKIVDVGALWLGEGREPYAALAKSVACQIIGFEPVETECKKLTELNLPSRTYLPYFIGDGGTHTFHECNYPMTSSLFEPNTPLLSKFQSLENLTQVVKTHAVETKRLDDIPETEGVDFLKLDVQGGELLVLNGAERRLEDALAIHTEVEFVPLYKGQPLFSDIDAHLRAHGFAFHQISLQGRTFKPLIMNGDANAMLSQRLWGDAVYIRDFMAFAALTPEQLLKIAVICHENYQSYDLAGVALEEYDRKMKTDLQMTYLQALSRELSDRKAPSQ